MLLVDTSVLIDFLKGRKNDKADLLESALSRDIPFGISVYTYQEILQGARDEREFERLQSYLATQVIYYPPADPAFYDKAARLFFDQRRRGITVRSTIDVLIAMTAIENKLTLLHNNRDFDVIASAVPDLKILNSL